MTMPSLEHGLPTLEALVLDDDAEIRELLAGHVRSRGLKVGVATDGVRPGSDPGLTPNRLAPIARLGRRSPPEAPTLNLP
jgi:CheY-like chemotaxis protein